MYEAVNQRECENQDIAHSMNPDNERLYAANRLTVTRQVHYSQREPMKSLDLVLSLNGIPVATAEL
ncbi:hypothetical protein LCGC14_2901550, partial [marine sediment metagenome]